MDQIAAAKESGDQAALAQAEKAKADLILGNDFTEGFYQKALERAHSFEDKLKKSSLPGAAAAATQPSSDVLAYEVGGQSYRRVGDNLVPVSAPKRHAGGPLSSGETVIKGGNEGQEWVTPAVMAKRFSESVQGMEDLLSKVSRQPDLMTSDARQFMSGGATTMDVTGSVRHDGEVTLNLGDGVEGLLRQLAELFSQNSKGASVRVGDKVLRPVVAG
jgi:hypothetical protein